MHNTFIVCWYVLATVTSALADRVALDGAASSSSWLKVVPVDDVVHGAPEPPFEVPPAVHPVHHPPAAPPPPPPPTSSPRMILPLYSLGLGNRLRTMSSLAVLAADADRVLHVDWHPSPSCNVTLNDVLTEPGAGWAVYPQDTPSSPSLGPWFRDAAATAAGVSATTFTHRRADGRPVGEGGGRFDFGDSVDPPPFPVHSIKGNTVDLDDMLRALRLSHDSDPAVIVRATGVFRPLHLSCQEYLVRRSAFYKSLQPVPFIADAVNEFYDRHMRHRLVFGVHIRVDDPDHDWPVIPSGSSTTDFQTTSPVGLFVQALDQLFRRHPRAVAFLATNSAAVRAHVMARFGEHRVLVFTPSPSVLAAAGGGPSDHLNRGSSVGIKLAMIDWWLLSRTALLLGSFYSSFSEEAAMVNLIPRVMVRADGHIRGFDTSTPGCGFIYDDPAAVDTYAAKLRSAQPGATGPSVDTMSDTHTVVLQPCTSFTSAWGLDSVFC